MDYKLYFRKSSFKKDISNAKLLLDLVIKNKSKNFLEIGVLEGATSRNICETLSHINQNNFSFIGIDLFGLDKEINNLKEHTPLSDKYSNPLKYIYFNLILRLNPNSEEAVLHLLKKFSNFVNLYKGYSHEVLNKIDISKVDFVFLDGGHSYETVSMDLKILIKNLKNSSIILCDDYNIKHYGVKKAVDDIKGSHYFEDLGRFALIKIKNN